MTAYTVPPVENKADISKQIEIEMENLRYFNYLHKDEAFKQATQYIEEKYKSVIENLKKEGKY